ncbi:MAG: hypothetical protein ACXAAK_11950, partial [Candidatus Thorarchaeota archaeon]
MGANSYQKFRRITLPHILPSLLAASILTFLFCFMSFPIILAFGQGRFLTIEAQIWNAFRFFDYGQASSLTLIQLLITLTLAIVYVRLSGQPKNSGGVTATIKTIGFNQMFGAYGVIDSIFMWIQSSSVSVFNLATDIPGIILAHTFYNIPLVLLMVSA